ncbi:MAG: hypothetical protein IKM20_00510 [Erysipelotrichales bacterium]|nr:hypothetical protein [Erysipelotrichales bacterium]
MANNEYIIDYIDKYIWNTKIEAAAVMINGNWGSGKSYFIKNVLLPKLKNKNRRKKYYYVTMNGVSSSDELQKRINAAVIRFNLEKEDKDDIASFITGIDALIEEENLLLNTNLLFNILGKTKKLLTSKLLKDAVFVFDDFERCSMETSNSLGIINDLIEHKNCKCIIVANEIEVGKKDDYKKIKEKFISRTLEFKSDIDSFLSELYLRSFCNENDLKIGEMLWDIIKKEILRIFDGNLRTIQSTIIISNEVYHLIKSLVNSENDMIQELIYKTIVLDIYRIEQFYVKNNEKIDSMFVENNNYYDLFLFDKNYDNYEYSFRFIHEIIREGKFDEQYILKSIDYYINMLKFDGELSPHIVLKDWYKMEDEDLQLNYDKMMDILINDEYELSLYQEILRTSLILSELGFKNKYGNSIEEVINIMKNNISKREYYHFEFSGLAANLSEESILLLKTTLCEFDTISKNNYINARRNGLNLFMENQNWGESIFCYLKNYRNDFVNERRFLYYFDINKLYNVMIESSNLQLTEFRNALSLLYQRGASYEIFPDDCDNAKLLNKLLSETEVQGKINKKTVSCIIKDLDDYFNLSYNYRKL